MIPTRRFVIPMVLLILTSTASALTVGYSTAPLLSEESLVWDNSRVEMYGIGFPKPIGGLYVSAPLESAPFRWYFDATAGKSEYYASLDSSLHDIQLVYSHMEAQYFICGNPYYFVGAGFEYIFMKQSLPEDAIFDTYTSTHGAPIASLGARFAGESAEFGIKYTYRLMNYVVRQRFGSGELSLLIGFLF